MNKQEAKKALNAWLDFTELCRLLFSGNDNCPYLINDLKKGKWCKMAKEIAAEMKIDWKKMTTAESNAIMLAMLEDSYQSIREKDDEHYVINFSITDKLDGKAAEATEVKENEEQQSNEPGE